MDSKKSVPCELTHLREIEIHIQPNLGHVLEQKAHWLAHGADSEELDDVGVVELGEEVGLLLEVHSHVLGCLFLWYNVVILGKICICGPSCSCVMEQLWEGENGRNEVTDYRRDTIATKTGSFQGFALMTKKKWNVMDTSTNEQSSP